MQFADRSLIFSLFRSKTFENSNNKKLIVFLVLRSAKLFLLFLFCQAVKHFMLSRDMFDVTDLMIDCGT